MCLTQYQFVMNKTLKTVTIVIASVVSFLLLIYVLANCGIASAIAESAVKRKTGCDIDVSGLHIGAGRPFPTVKVSADSICFDGDKDTLTVRARDVKVRVHIRRDSVFTQFYSVSDFVRFGSNRLVLNDISLCVGISRKDSTLWGTRFSLSAGESKFISTLYPIETKLKGLFIEKGTDELFINDISVQSGTSDISVNAAVGNMAGFASGKGELETVMSVKVDNLNVNEFLAGIYYGIGDGKAYYSPSEEEDESFIVPGKYVGYPLLIKEIIPLLIPERVKLSADVDVKKARVAILNISGFMAHLDVLDKAAKVSDCTFDSNFGKVNTTLFYSSPSRDSLLAGADLKLKDFSAKDISVLIPKKNSNITPLLNSFKGKFQCQATVTTQVDTAFIPIVSTLKGIVNFQGHDMSITDAGNLRKYTSMLMFRNKDIGDIDDVNMYAIVSDSKMKVFPMTLGVDRYLLAMTGSHSFKNMFDYDISIIKSPIPFKFGIGLHNEGGKGKVKFKLKKPTYQDANLPPFYREVSAAQNKLNQMIDDVLEEGAVQTYTKGSHMTEELFYRHKGVKATSITESDTELRDSVMKYINPKPKVE